MQSPDSPDKIKPLMGWFLVVFLASFLGAAWTAYAALRMGAALHTWVSLSLAGAVAAGILAAGFSPLRHIFFQGRPRTRGDD